MCAASALCVGMVVCAQSKQQSRATSMDDGREQAIKRHKL